MIFTSLSPNTELDDVWLAVRLLCKPWTWRRGTAVSALETALAQYVPIRHVIAANCGRTALSTILAALGIGVGDEVLLQGFTCVAVAGPVLWRGAAPVYVDCETDSLGMSPDDMRAKITPRTKAVIIQHTLGMPAQLGALLAIARAHKLMVIEDCAHALGATYHDRRVGTFGDVSFFSFGRDKVISSVFGGAIATNDEALSRRIREIVQFYPLPSRWWIVLQLKHPLILAFAKATYGFFGVGKALLGVARALSLISLAVEPAEREGGKPTFLGKRMPNALALLALHQLAKLDRYNDHRRRLARSYRAHLSAHVPMLDEHSAVKPMYLRFPIFVDDPRGLIAFARKKGIELGDWYQTPVAPRDVNLEAIRYTSCPVAQDLAKRVVNLPTGIQISPGDAARVSAVVNEYLHARH